MSSYPSAASILLVICGLMIASQAVTFTCNTTSTATCQSLIGYVSANATTYANLTSLFQVPLSAILGANNLSNTSKSDIVKAGSTVRIPIQCKCSQGIGQSDKIPVYTVVSGDQLDAIARNKFDQFVNYTEIATANNISDPSLIQIGQKLWIPLPCSCDEVEGNKVAHLAYQVVSGNTVQTIAEEFGTTESTLLKLNGISNPKSLQADQILDVPLKACTSSINTTSPDYGLLLPKDAYEITANDCVMCTCSSSSYILDCMLAPDSKSSCHITPCSLTDSVTIDLGLTTSSGCKSSTCAYSGYTNTSSLTNIHTTFANQTTCASGSSSQMASTSSWMSFTICLHMILIWICFM